MVGSIAAVAHNTELALLREGQVALGAWGSFQKHLAWPLGDGGGGKGNTGGVGIVNVQTGGVTI